MKAPTIFVAIASYKDPLLQRTVWDAVDKAQHKHRLRFGIVDQCDAPQRWATPTGAFGRQMQYLWVDPLMSRGTCFARALAQQLYAGETLYVQLDAHMAFPPYWDAWVVDTLLDRMASGGPCVVSSYPPSMEWEGDRAVIATPAAGTVTCHRVNATAAFDARGIYLDFEACHHRRSQPVRAHHLSAAVLLAPGRFAEVFPYDPFGYYLGEEQMLALRLFTHGWDIWHPVDNPIGHKYNDHQDPAIRPVHWSDDPDGLRPIPHGVWQQESYRRQRRTVACPGFGGVYGLGGVRSLADYAAWTGIDYVRRTIDMDRARELSPEEGA